MANLKKRLNEILSELDENIKNKEDLEYVKSQIYNISLLFLDEIDKLAELNLGRLNVMIEREKELAKRVATMEKIIKNIEKEMTIEQECDFEIICPYCNTDFVEDFTNGYKHEVKCPECDNVIELDWHEENNCSCEEVEEEDNENEDDM